MQFRFHKISDDCSSQELKRLLEAGYLVHAFDDGTFKIPGWAAETILGMGQIEILPLRAYPWRRDHKAMRLPSGSMCTGPFLRRAKEKRGWTSFATGKPVQGSKFLRVYNGDGAVVAIVENVTSQIGANLRRRLTRAGIISQGATSERNAAFDTLADEFYLVKRNDGYYVLFLALGQGHGPLRRKQALALVRSLRTAGLVEDMGSERP